MNRAFDAFWNHGTDLNMFWVTAIMDRALWIRNGIFAAALVVFLYWARLFTRWLRARPAWAGIRGECTALVAAVRAHWKLAAVACLLLVSLRFLQAPFYRIVTEYSGSCGRFRTCASTFWGLRRQCESRPESTLQPFAAQAECAADWEEISFDLYWLGGGQAYGGGAGESAYRLMFLVKEFEDRKSGGRYRLGPGLDDNLRMYPGECAGTTTHASESEYAVVMPDLNEDGCWVLSSNRTLRHIRAAQAQTASTSRP